MEDTIWNFADEVTCPSYGAAMKRIIFDAPIWSRCPELLLPVKQYLWERRRGTAIHRPVSWNTIIKRYGHLIHFAEYLESIGVQRWSDLTPVRWAQVVTLIPATHAQSPMLHEARGVLKLLSSVEPLYPIPVSRYKPKNQTPPIPDSIMRQMIPAALAWESRIPDLLRLQRKFVKEDPWAIEHGVVNPRALKVALGQAQASAMILMLAATGMRVSELLSLKKGTGQSVPTENGERWYVWGTVFKFHGKGCRARWYAGPIGKRAYQMLCALSPVQDLCVTLWRHAHHRIARDSVSSRLAEWMKREGIALPSGKPLRSHPFRRTFVRQLIMHSSVTLLGLKDQLKHKKLTMTDYYVGCDAELHQALLGESPAKRSNQCAREMIAALEGVDEE